jgi:hypothetical protein
MMMVSARIHGMSKLADELTHAMAQEATTSTDV